MRATEIRGRSVLDVDTARELGRVEACLLDPSESRIVGFRVSGPSPVLGLADVRAIGTDAVTVEGDGAVRQPRDHAESRAVELGLDPLGSRLLSDDGTELGVTQDLEFDDGGRIRLVEAGSHVIDGGRILGLGDWALVVRA